MVELKNTDAFVGEFKTHQESASNRLFKIKVEPNEPFKYLFSLGANTGAMLNISVNTNHIAYTGTLIKSGNDIHEIFLTTAFDNWVSYENQWDDINIIFYEQEDDKLHFYIKNIYEAEFEVIIGQLLTNEFGILSSRDRTYTTDFIAVNYINYKEFFDMFFIRRVTMQYNASVVDNPKNPSEKIVALDIDRADRTLQERSFCVINHLMSPEFDEIDTDKFWILDENFGGPDGWGIPIIKSWSVIPASWGGEEFHYETYTIQELRNNKTNAPMLFFFGSVESRQGGVLGFFPISSLLPHAHENDYSGGQISYNSLVDQPDLAQFATNEHTHSISETTGTLPLNRGGTNRTAWSNGSMPYIIASAMEIIEPPMNGVDQALVHVGNVTDKPAWSPLRGNNSLMWRMGLGNGGDAASVRTAIDAAQTIHTHVASDISDIDALVASINSNADLKYALITHIHNATDIEGLIAAIDTEIAKVVGAAPEALDTLQEIAAALKNNPAIIDSILTAIDGKADSTHTHGLATTDITGTLPVNKGGTNRTSQAAGNINYATSTTATGVVAAPTANVTQVLAHTGTVATVPAWRNMTGATSLRNDLGLGTGSDSASIRTAIDAAQTEHNHPDKADTVHTHDDKANATHSHGLATTDVTGTLPVARGGTNRTSQAAGNINYATSATATGVVAAPTANVTQALVHTGAVATVPAWRNMTGATSLRNDLGLGTGTEPLPIGANLGDTGAEFGQTIAHGSATTFARSDHRHPLPTLPKEVMVLECTTAIGTAAKVVNDAARVPVAGELVVVNFTVGNNAASPTLNIRTSASGGTARAIRVNGNNIVGTTGREGFFLPNRPMLFRFNGTQYDLLNPTFDRTMATKVTGTDSANATLSANNPGIIYYTV